MLYGYLFYSNKYDSDGFCKSLITLLERHGLDKIFEYKLIDDMSEEQLVKLQIESVPTLLVIFENNGTKQQQLFTGEKAFNWVDSFLISRRQALIKKAENSRKTIQGENAKERMKDGLCDYCPLEHVGISDTYAYYNEDESKDINLAQTKMYSQYNPNVMENDNIGAIPVSSTGGIKDYRAKEGLNATFGNDISRVINNVENDRKKQDEQLKNIIDQNTIKTVANSLAKNNY
jgi:hypothetical protein